MDILFINPSINPDKDQEYIKSLRVDPDIPRQSSPKLGIAYMMAQAEKRGLNVEYIDMVAYNISINELLNYIKQNNPNMIGFTAFTVQVKTASIIALEIKKHFPEVMICLGGPHAIAMPEETKREFPVFDMVFSDEGEMLISFKLFDNLDKLCFPAWDKFDLTKYGGADPHQTKLELPISTSRGCPFNCVFCNRQFGQYRRHRSIKSIIDEIYYDIENFGATAINFCDETFVVDMKFSKNLFQRIIDEKLNDKIKWSCETRVDICDNELFEMMKESGCYYIFFGFESGDNEILLNSGKNFVTDDIINATSMAKNNGIVCCGSFILGLPGESEDSAMKSIHLAKKIDVYSTTFPIAVPFPNTDIRKMAENGDFGLRILSNDWDLYGKQTGEVMDSRYLVKEDLQKLQQYAYKYNPKKNLNRYISRIEGGKKIWA